MKTCRNKIQTRGALSKVCAFALGFLLAQTGTAVLAGGSWYSKAHIPAQELPAGLQPFALSAAGDIGTTVFDIVISLYNDPAGDDDPDNDTGSEEQTNYEEIVRFFADAVCEQSNEELKLGKVRIFSNGIQGSLADVVWNASEWPRAMVSGFGSLGLSITFGDEFPEGCGTGCDIDFLNSSSHEDAGYTLGHEFGHYVLGLFDEYVGTDPAETRINFPQTGDTAVSPSIMNSQWRATVTGGGNDFSWLNHSTEDNYQDNTAQGRTFGASGWEVLVQETGDDPKDGDRASLPTRVRYTALSGSEPTAADGWVLEELPGAQTSCRSELDIIWMQDDVEMQLVIDRSDSMSGSPLSNAQQAANTLVDESENGKTAIGVVAFNDTASQEQPIVPILDTDDKTDIQTVISDLTASNRTAMFDAADLALDNMLAYASSNATNAVQLVFLLSDGLDNESSETQATVTAAYQDADVPLNTFAYGSFAPDGVLRQMAEDTGGLFRTAPTALAELASAFLAAKAAQTSSAAIIQSSADIAGSSSGDIGFEVDSTINSLSIFANYLGAVTDMDFSLDGPAGAVSGASFACNEVAGSTACSAAIDAAQISSAGTGTWFLQATNNTGSSIRVNVDILANPKPVRTFDLVIGTQAGSEITYPNPIVITAVTSKGLPITDLNISASITDPDGIVSILNLYDNGSNGDGIAGDGIYSAIVDYSLNGIYALKASVNNDVMTARFTADAFQPAHAHSADENGKTPLPPILPPITENFTRTASVQFNVSGVVGDDHPNEPPGTAVDPDNSDTPGRIEMSTDVDVFTVQTAGYDSLTFRVTGLALGMTPRLRILAEDGETVLLSAVIEDLVGDPNYLALAVPTAGNNQLHAEVSHASGGTGTYQFSVGNRIITDPALFELDIMPDTSENPVNLEKKGRVPVVVVGNPLYDVSGIDPESLAFGPGGAPALHPRGGVIDDFSGDALVDYLNHYKVTEAGISSSDTQICLSGHVNSVPFTACDGVSIVPPRN